MSFSFDLQFSSRAVDEDDEYGEQDEQQEEIIRNPIVRWSPKATLEMSSSGGIKCSSLLVVIGSAATGFVEIHLLRTLAHEIIGAVCMGSDDRGVSTFSQEASSDQSCFIYRLVDHPGVVAVQCKVNVSPEHLFSFSEQVMSKLCSPLTAVTVLSASSIAEYKSPFVSSELPLSFLRCLKSSKCNIQFIYPPLEQPNIVSGLSAQILTYCQIHCLSCILYQCFASTHCLQSEAIKALQGLLSCSPFKNILHRQNGDQELRNFCDARDNHIMLYS